MCIHIYSYTFLCKTPEPPLPSPHSLFPRDRAELFFKGMTKNYLSLIIILIITTIVVVVLANFNLINLNVILFFF